MNCYNKEYQKMTKEIFKDNDLYNDKIVLNNFSNIGFIDSSFSNDLVPSFILELRKENYIQIFLANSTINNYDEELFNTSNVYINNEILEELPIFESKDIWIIWSFIKSNLDYFKTL